MEDPRILHRGRKIRRPGTFPVFFVLRGEKYSTLGGAGFEPTYEKDLWKKDGVWFGKEAALQHAWREVAN